MNGVGASQSIAAPAAELPVNRWIVGEVVNTLAELDKAFDELRFDDMANAIYHFTWGTFCDWYVELVKGAFDDETKRVAAWAFDQILVMLHPFMPFVTEELWNANERPYELIVAKRPEPQFGAHPQQAEFDGAFQEMSDKTGMKVHRNLDELNKWLIETTIDVIREIRTARAELSIPWSVTLKPVVVMSDRYDPTLLEILEEDKSIARLAKIAEPSMANVAPPNSVQIVVRGWTIALPLEGVVDLDAERGRLAKAVAAVEKERDSLAARLSNPAFAERAKPEAVEKARADYAEKSAEAERYRAALERLG
jgi:valyl-tRNA synthetase